MKSQSYKILCSELSDCSEILQASGSTAKAPAKFQSNQMI